MILQRMAWAKPEFGSKTRIDAAGEALISEAGLSDADLVALNNWRSVHSCPLLTMRMALGNRAKHLDHWAVVSQRIKRIQAIKLKLEENRKAGLTMNLSQMQDIGGCRATVGGVQRVDELVRSYESSWKKNANRGGSLKKKHDYIDLPKPTGYRGIHFICKYHSDSKDLKIYNGLQIEIQLRSKMQHYWATAVETVDFFTGQTLKSNIGQLPWKRFFVLVSNEFARIERRPLVSGAPLDKSAAIAELKGEHRHQLTAIEGIQAAHKVFEPERADKNQLYLLQLDLGGRTIQRTVFSTDRINEAQQKYLDIEMQNKDDPSKQAVLVSVDSMNALQKAYPSFYLDIGEFSKVVNRIIR